MQNDFRSNVNIPHETVPGKVERVYQIAKRNICIGSKDVGHIDSGLCTEFLRSK